MGSKKRKRSSGHPARRATSAPSSGRGRPAVDRQPAEDSTSHPLGAPAGTAAQVPAGQASRSANRSRRLAVGSARSRTREDGLLAMAVDETQLGSRGCLSASLTDVHPQVVAVTYSFAADDQASAMRFLGMREDVEGPRGSNDMFDRIERLPERPQGAGRVSVTTRVEGITAGQWKVLAQPLGPSGEIERERARMVRTQSHYGLLAHGPRVTLGAWPALVGLGALVALVVQAMLAARAGIGVTPILGVSLFGCLLGFVGGKLWYLGLHRRPLREFLHSGACIQGFLLAALAVLAGGSLLLDLPVGLVLDVTTPGIFLGVAVGRPGCFLTGCCAGRPTASWWGLVSSDRRLVMRRFPVQLLEALAGLMIGVLSLTGVLAGLRPAGSVFVASVSGYTLVRQLLFPLRVESRTRAGRVATLAACAAVVLGIAALWLR